MIGANLLLALRNVAVFAICVAFPLRSLLKWDKDCDQHQDS